MATDSGPLSKRWRGGLATTLWNEDERAYAALLDVLTSGIVAAEAAELERDAGSRRSMADVREEQDRLESQQVAEARQELSAFREALEDARARSGDDGQREATYDSAQPDQDAKADLLIQYLVRPDYAEVRTEEPQPGRHVYHLRIAWDRLRALAEKHGQTFPL
jgi:hypothetical protein